MPPPSPYGIRLSFAQNGSSPSSGASFPLAVVHWRNQPIYEKSTTAHRRKKDTLSISTSDNLTICDRRGTSWPGIARCRTGHPLADRQSIFSLLGGVSATQTWALSTVALRLFGFRRMRGAADPTLL